MQTLTTLKSVLIVAAMVLAGSMAHAQSKASNELQVQKNAVSEAKLFEEHERNVYVKLGQCVRGANPSASTDLRREMVAALYGKYGREINQHFYFPEFLRGDCSSAPIQSMLKSAGVSSETEWRSKNGNRIEYMAEVGVIN